jgi:uncharacterized protein (DUF983 family)
VTGLRPLKGVPGRCPHCDYPFAYYDLVRDVYKCIECLREYMVMKR